MPALNASGVDRLIRFFTAPVGQGTQDVIRALTVLAVLALLGWATGWLRQLGLNVPDPPQLLGRQRAGRFSVFPAAGPPPKPSTAYACIAARPRYVSRFGPRR